MIIKDKSPKERRAYFRTNIAKGSASLLNLKQSPILTAYFLKDISEEGIFLEGVKDIKIGTICHLVIKLNMPDKEGLWMIDVEVIHTVWHKGKDNRTVGTGFKYRNLTVEEQGLMHTYVAWLRECHLIEGIQYMKQAMSKKIVVVFFTKS